MSSLLQGKLRGRRNLNLFFLIIYPWICWLFHFYLILNIFLEKEFVLSLFKFWFLIFILDDKNFSKQLNEMNQLIHHLHHIHCMVKRSVRWNKFFSRKVAISLSHISFKYFYSNFLKYFFYPSHENTLKHHRYNQERMNMLDNYMDRSFFLLKVKLMEASFIWPPLLLIVCPKSFSGGKYLCLIRYLSFSRPTLSTIFWNLTTSSGPS